MNAVETTACAFAHSANARGVRHALLDHLLGTAERARKFGSAFGQDDACYAAGLWHDIGKVVPEFQRYLEACETPRRPPRGPNHKDAGAVQAVATAGAAHIAPLLLGHHGGIPDVGDAATIIQAARSRADVDAALQWSSDALPAIEGLRPPARKPASDFDISLRLIYSALVDADFLDTEAHFNDARTSVRTRSLDSVPALAAREETAHRAFLSARSGTSHVDGIRAEIRETALAAAAWEPGLFRLTVPTGGGKTRSGLAFALRHARAWGLNRVIVALPYLTITEQTADVYREILGPSAVLEHHSAIEPRGDDDPILRVWRRLAAENWDAPVIVTTTLQLFESLFSNRPAALRKAHRVARSVVILDEAQTLPLRVLGVTSDALAAMARVAGCSIVLCTATQPALEEINSSLGGSIREIVPQYATHFAALRRVVFDVPARHGAWSWQRVAAELRAADQAMVVVNRRRDAVALLDSLDTDAYHLSTLLCGAHRRHVLDRVRHALDDGHPCRLVATQVVEAGVDLDFPLVFRALAPFDSVVQAAGRCNREALRAEGRCIVFRPEQPDTYGAYRRGAETLDGMLREAGCGTDIDFGDPAVCAAYYRRLYGSGSVLEPTVDPRGMRKFVADLQFETLAAAYHLIDEPTTSVVVAYPPAGPRVQRLLQAIGRAEEPARARRLLRLLQPYVVSLRPWEVERARMRGLIEDQGDLAVWRGTYDMRTGVAAVLGDPKTPDVVGRRGGGGYVI